MKKLIGFTLRIKTPAAMIFSGLICLYVVAGFLYGAFFESEFVFAIPFIFILEAVGLSLLISILWGVFFTDEVIKKWRYFPRLILFSLSLLALLFICLLVFFAFHTNEAKLWLIVAGAFAAGVAGLSVICEIYFRVTGKRYTEILKEYKADIM